MCAYCIAIYSKRKDVVVGQGVLIWSWALCVTIARIAGVERGRGQGSKGKRDGDWGERVRNTYYKNLLLLISVDTGTRKLLIGWAVMSNLLGCVLVCISDRQTRCRHQGNVFYWHKLWKIKITPMTCSNFTLKPKLEPTVIACLAGRDAQEVLYTGFVQTPSCNSRQLQFLPDICNADIHKTAFSTKTYTISYELLNGL